MIVCQTRIDSLHIFGHLKLSRSDKVDVIDRRIAFGVDFLATIKLTLSQVVIDPGDCVLSQILKDSIIF